MRVLATGATGYIGSRLIPRLLTTGHEVRALTRDPGRLDGVPWRDRVEVAAGDVLDPGSLADALAGCQAAYYLVRQTGPVADSEARERRGATHFQQAADAAGLRRLVYLASLGPRQGPLPTHLRSRREVGRLLAAGTTPVTELRAALIVGSGSLSFEMLRYLTEVLPVMPVPRWARSRCQPIAVDDLLDLLTGAVDDPDPASRVLDIGGPEVLSCQDMMRIYAHEVGLRRILIPLPVRAPRLSSLWVGLVTPLSPKVARQLVDGLRRDAVAGGDGAQLPFPHQPLPYRDALRRALATPPDPVPTPQPGTMPAPAQPAPWDPEWSGGRVFTDRRVIPTEAAPHHLFWAFSRVGGDVGYYGLNWAWRLRAWLDRLVGGVGMRRGRRHPEHLREGEELDFWRVDRITPGRLLRLRAEMRLPGDAYLQWEVAPAEGGSDLVQTAVYRPHGLLGRVYWYLMAPIHSYIFGHMAWQMAAAAEERDYSCP
jgi:uncharacterized protein YbjT (DUF2867 family)